MGSLASYLADVRAYKDKLFGLYAAAGAVLGRKETARGGGTSWGYRLISCPGYDSGGKPTGTSIGDDEIRIFYDICQLIQPRHSLVIGNGFGVSAFALALGWPEGEVVAMDNWSEGEAGIVARDLSLKICHAAGMSKRVTIFTGTSPADIPAAVRPWLEGGMDKLDLAFIDGLHTDAAAAADFQGLQPYLRPQSVVLWHNIHATSRAFQETADGEGGTLWLQHPALRTYGPLGIYYHPVEQPALHQYLQLTNLIWNDWSRYLRALLKSGTPAPAQPVSFDQKARRGVRSLIQRIRRL
jgi:predicted O-methyltransferase YrrM